MTHLPIVEMSAGNQPYRFDHWPLCDAAKRTGVQEIALAHHALNALLRETIHAIDPDLSVCMPTDRNDEHVLGLAQ